MNFVSIILTVVAVVLLVPALVLGLQCVLGSTSRFACARPEDVQSDRRPDCRVAVVMPAHNESDVVADAVLSLMRQTSADDRVLVVADNCTDDTAARARVAGAAVTERTDAERRGKGWALDHGIRQLEADPPDVVILMDSDCIAQPGLVATLAAKTLSSGRPVQSQYRMLAPSDAPDVGRPARFAWRLKNIIRSEGFARLGLPCQLAGSGMAFPWAMIASAPLASSDLVEDLKLGLDLAEAGSAPLFAANAFVDSELPLQQSAQETQKERWVQGHLRTIAGRALPMFARGIANGDRHRVAMALDLAVLPFGLLVMLLAAGFLLGLAMLLFGASWIPAALFALGLIVAIGGVLLAWARAGRDLISPADLVGFGTTLLGKLPLYLGVIVRRQTRWVRTERGSADSTDD